MSPDDNFLRPGRTCSCDSDFRCGNHDDAAEEAHWFTSWVPAVQEPAEVDILLAYDPYDPKRRALLGEFA